MGPTLAQPKREKRKGAIIIMPMVATPVNVATSPMNELYAVGDSCSSRRCPACHGAIRVRGDRENGPCTTRTAHTLAACV